MSMMSGRPSLWWRFWHAWSVRVVWLALRRDPRCRPSDRLEAVAVLSLAAVLVAAVPLAILLGLTTMGRSLTTAHQQQLDRRPTSALVVTSKADDSNAAYPAMSVVGLTWTGPTGARLHDTTRVAGAPEVGTHLTIWTSRDGRRADPPITVLQAVLRAWTLAFLCLALVVMLGSGLLAAIRQTLMRSRIRSWDAEWVEVASDRRA